MSSTQVADRLAPPARPLTIGRDPGNEVVVEDPLASRHHAILRPLPDGTWILSDRSANGTLVSGSRVHRGVASMTNGSSLIIGSHTFVLQDGRLLDGPSGNDVLTPVESLPVEHQSRSMPPVLAPEPNDEVLNAIGLAVFVGDGRALIRDIGLSVRKSEMLAIVGPSGSGKSTLLRALAGVRPADRGEVSLSGGSAGYVPQDDVLHSTLRVRQALRFGARLRFPNDVSDTQVGERVDEVLQQLNLSDRAEHRINVLSGGERKRVNVALELVTKPALLFLDEPTAGLDPAAEASMIDQFRDMCATGCALVVVTHATQCLNRFDRVLELTHDGQVRFFGRADEYQATLTNQAFNPALDQPVAQPRARRQAHPTPTWSNDLGKKPLRIRPVLSPRRQFTTLVRRFMAVLASDRKHLVLLIAQAPLIGGLLMVLTHRAFVVNDERTSKGGMALLSVVLGVAYIGASNAARELVKERPMYDREKLFGVSRRAYVGSKFVVLGLLTVLQSICLVVLGLGFAGVSSSGVFLSPSVVELLGTIVLVGFAALSMGLLLSALSSTTDRATAALPVVLLTMYLLSGGPTNPEKYPVLRELSHVNVAKWGLAAGAATVDLHHLNGCDADGSVIEREDRCQARWANTPGALLTSWLALGTLSIVALSATVCSLNRHGNQRTQSARRRGQTRQAP